MPTNDDSPERRRAQGEPQRARPYADPTDRTDFDIHIDQPGGPVPARYNEPEGEKSKSKSDEKPKTDSPELKKSSAANTRAKTAQITPTDDMRAMLNRMQDIDTSDEIDDDEAARRAGLTGQAAAAQDRQTPNMDAGEIRRVIPEYPNLPAVIRNDLAVINQELDASGMVYPEWHTIANLPGYMSRAIRAMGRGSFKMFTNTDLEEIVTIANVNGQGPNSDRELNAVAGWLKAHGEDMGDVTIDYSRVMPGYEPKVREFRLGDTRFHFVIDQFGKYIYAYPEKDAVSYGNENKLGHDSNKLGYSDDEDDYDDLDYGANAERDEYGAPIKRIRESGTKMKQTSINESIRHLVNKLETIQEYRTDEELNREIMESFFSEEELDEANIRKVRDPETKRMAWKSTEERPYSTLDKIIGDSPGGKQMVAYVHKMKELWGLDADASWGSVPFRGDSKNVAWKEFKNHPDKFIIVVGDKGVAAVKPSEQQIKAQREKRGPNYNPATDTTLKYQVKAYTAKGAVPNQLIADPNREPDDEYPMLHRGRGGLPTRRDVRNTDNIFDRLVDVIGYPSKIVYAQDAVPREKREKRAAAKTSTVAPGTIDDVKEKIKPIFQRLVQQTLGRIGPQIGRLSQAGNYDQANNLARSGQRLQALLAALDADNINWNNQYGPIGDFHRIIVASVNATTQGMGEDEKKEFISGLASGKAAYLSELLAELRNKLFKIYSL